MGATRHSGFDPEKFGVRSGARKSARVALPRACLHRPVVRLFEVSARYDIVSRPQGASAARAWGTGVKILKASFALAALLASAGIASAQQSRGDAFRAIGQELQQIQNGTAGRGKAGSGVPASAAAPDPSGVSLRISGTVSASVGYVSPLSGRGSSRPRSTP